MKSCALYARVSTLDQHAGMQLEELRRFATKRFDEAIEYVDEGVSGIQRRRPALDRLLADARKRRFDVVLAWKFDRFARSLKHLIDALEEFRSLGIDFISLTEGIDTTTPSGQLLFHVVGAVAQFERDLISEHVCAGLAHARAMGRRIGRPPNAVDGEAVRRLRAEGKSLRAIAAILNTSLSAVRRICPPVVRKSFSGSLHGDSGPSYEGTGKSQGGQSQ